MCPFVSADVRIRGGGRLCDEPKECLRRRLRLWFHLNFGAGNFRGRRPGTSALRMLLRLTAVNARPGPFSSPEAALLLVSTKNRDLWPSPTPEVRDSRTSRYSAHVQSQV